MLNEDLGIKIKYVLLGILIFSLQVGFGNSIRIFGVAPNILLCYVMCISFRNYDSFSFYNALISGAALDAVSGRIFGEYTFFFILFDIVIDRVFYKIFTENFYFEFFGGIILNFAFSFVFALVTWLFKGNFLFLTFRICLIETIYNSLIFLVFLSFSKKTKRKRRSAFRI